MTTVYFDVETLRQVASCEVDRGVVVLYHNEATGAYRIGLLVDESMTDGEPSQAQECESVSGSGDPAADFAQALFLLVQTATRFTFF